MTSKWRRRTFDAHGLTEYPAGPNLARRTRRKLYVTSPGFDNIGEILTSMNVDYELFTGLYDCTILFINCGTSDVVDPSALAEFVRGGGCVYASDHAEEVIARAFRGVFEFGGRLGGAGPVTADVIDPELKDLIGQRTKIEFDMGGWSILLGGGETLLEAACEEPRRTVPIMSYAEVGKGSIFYTCFHNKAQTSAEEKQLLRLLVVKQFSTTSRQTMAQTGRVMGISLGR